MTRIWSCLVQPECMQITRCWARSGFLAGFFAILTHLVTATNSAAACCKNANTMSVVHFRPTSVPVPCHCSPTSGHDFPALTNIHIVTIFVCFVCVVSNLQSHSHCDHIFCKHELFSFSYLFNQPLRPCRLGAAAMKNNSVMLSAWASQKGGSKKRRRAGHATNGFGPMITSCPENTSRNDHTKPGH